MFPKTLINSLPLILNTIINIENDVDIKCDDYDEKIVQMPHVKQKRINVVMQSNNIDNIFHRLWHPNGIIWKIFD